MALLKHKAPLHATDGQMCALSLLSSLDRPSPVAVWKTGGLFKTGACDAFGFRDGGHSFGVEPDWRQQELRWIPAQRLCGSHTPQRSPRTSGRVAVITWLTKLVDRLSSELVH